MVSIFPFEFSLRRNATLKLHDPAGVRIECRTGTLWITLDGDCRDIVLGPGEWFSTDRHDLAIMNALADSCIKVCMNFTEESTKSFSILGKRRNDKHLSFSLV